MHGDSRSRGALALALAALVAIWAVTGPLATPRTAGAAVGRDPLVIYDNALQNGFAARASGGATLDLCTSNRYASAPCGILAAFAADGGTLAFETVGGFATADYAALEFSYGAEPGYLANLEVRLVGAEGAVLGRSRLGPGHVTAYPALGFSRVVVPLAALAPGGGTARGVQLVNTGGALVGIGLDDLQFVAAADPGCPVGQFAARYFPTIDLGGPAAITRCEAAIDHDWGFGGPGAGVGVDGFSARWTGRIAFAAGTYTFAATADDGIRVALDGATIIDGWRDQAPTPYTATRVLAAGEHELTVEYYENRGLASVHVAWAASAPSPGPTATPAPPPDGGYTIRQALPPCPSGKWQTTLDTGAPSFTVVCQP